jgi:hypothetical protein
MRGGWRDHSPLLTTGFTTLGFLFEGDISVEDTRFATWKIKPIVRVKGEAKARINIGKQKRAIPEPSLNFEDVSPHSFLMNAHTKCLGESLLRAFTRQKRNSKTTQKKVLVNSMLVGC